MSEEEYRAIAQQQLEAAYSQAQFIEMMRAQEAAVKRQHAFDQAQGFPCMAACYPCGIDKPENPPMKQANARVIEKPRLPEK